jgi:hypothetical protein
MDFWRALAIITALMKEHRYDEAWDFIQRNRCDDDGREIEALNVPSRFYRTSETASTQSMTSLHFFDGTKSHSGTVY